MKGLNGLIVSSLQHFFIPTKTLMAYFKLFATLNIGVKIFISACAVAHLIRSMQRVTSFSDVSCLFRIILAKVDALSSSTLWLKGGTHLRGLLTDIRYWIFKMTNWSSSLKNKGGLNRLKSAYYIPSQKISKCYFWQCIDQETGAEYELAQ